MFSKKTRVHCSTVEIYDFSGSEVNTVADQRPKVDDRNNGVTLEAGYGTVNGSPMYYEKGGQGDPSRLDIFPGGLPDHRKHDHTAIVGQDLIYSREKGHQTIDTAKA